MTDRARRLLRDVHHLALRYHWSEGQTLRLSLARRAAYLALLEADDDRSLLSALDAP
jgi:hypothetical protein